MKQKTFGPRDSLSFRAGFRLRGSGYEIADLYLALIPR